MQRLRQRTVLGRVHPLEAEILAWHRGSELECALGIEEPDLREIVIERAGEQDRHILERFEKALAEQGESGELVERERLAAVCLIASQHGLASELERDELGHARRYECVCRGEGASDAQCDEHAGDRVGRDQWSDHRRTGDPVIGQADRRLRLHRRPAPPSLFDGRASRVVSDRILDDVVTVSASRSIDGEGQRVELTELRECREPDGPLVGIACDLWPHRDDRWRKQTANDRRHRRFLANDAICGGAK